MSGESEKQEFDRDKEKDDFDGTDGTFRTGSVENNQSAVAKEAPRKERDLTNCPDVYKQP